MSEVTAFEPKHYKGLSALRASNPGQPGSFYYGTDNGVTYGWNGITVQWDDLTHNRSIGLGRIAPMFGTVAVAWLAVGFIVFDGSDFVGIPTSIHTWAGYLGGPVSNVDMQILDITNATTIWQGLNIGPAGILICSSLANISTGPAYWQVQMQAGLAGTQFGGGEVHMVKDN